MILKKKKDFNQLRLNQISDRNTKRYLSVKANIYFVFSVDISSLIFSIEIIYTGEISPSHFTIPKSSLYILTKPFMHNYIESATKFISLFVALLANYQCLSANSEWYKHMSHLICSYTYNNSFQSKCEGFTIFVIKPIGKTSLYLHIYIRHNSFSCHYIILMPKLFIFNFSISLYSFGHFRFGQLLKKGGGVVQ